LGGTATPLVTVSRVSHQRTFDVQEDHTKWVTLNIKEHGAIIIQFNVTIYSGEVNIILPIIVRDVRTVICIIPHKV
jgi:L-cysteine desulfidase